MKFILLILVNWICITSMAQNQIYVSAYTNIYVVDPFACTSVLKGTTKQFWDIAFTPDGRLWGIDEYGVIYELDTSSMDTTFVADTEIQSSSLEGFDDSSLVAVSNQDLYKINVNTGAVTLLGNVGYNPSGDLTWYDNHLYLNSNHLVRIQLDLSLETVVEVEQVSSIGYDGMDGYALGVSPAIDATNGLFVFDAYHVYQVCQIDGSTRMQCPSLFPHFAYGAASRRLPVQDPEPTYCRTMMDTAATEILYLVNQTDDQITVYSNLEFENISVSLYDATGQLVRENVGLNGVEFSFSTQNLVPGFYILQILNGKESEAHKLLLY